MQTHSENMQMKGAFAPTERPVGSVGSMSIPTSERPSRPSPLSSATAECLRLRRSQTSSDKSSRCETASPKPTSSKTSAPPSTISVKGFNPYWDESCAERSSRLWLPKRTDSFVSDLNSLTGLSATAAANSWFSANIKENPNANLPKTYWPSFMASLAGKTNEPITRAKRIRMRPTRSQEKRLNAWIGTYRFVYNETIWLLNLRIVQPNFMGIKKTLIPHLAKDCAFGASFGPSLVSSRQSGRETQPPVFCESSGCHPTEDQARHSPADV